MIMVDKYSLHSFYFYLYFDIIYLDRELNAVFCISLSLSSQHFDERKRKGRGINTRNIREISAN